MLFAEILLGKGEAVGHQGPGVREKVFRIVKIWKRVPTVPLPGCGQGFGQLTPPQHRKRQDLHQKGVENIK